MNGVSNQHAMPFDLLLTDCGMLRLAQLVF
jgi:hypothetical protein